MKISVVFTVLNEENSVTSLLLSLFKQSPQPDEIVTVDGGSIDKTVQKITSFQKKHPELNISLIKEKGNISHGRNIGVENAKNEIIAMIDAGCTADKNWLQNISEDFNDKSISVVAGFYEMSSKTPFQKAVAPFLGITKIDFDPRSFLPSARSIAFRKSTWRKIGKFDESLTMAGEDTLFNYSLLKKHIKMSRRADAIVFWEVPSSVYSAFLKFYHYAKGDAQTGIWWHPTKKLRTHNLKAVSIFLRYAFFLFLLLSSLVNLFCLYLFIVFFTIYLFWAITKMKRKVTELRPIVIVPFIQIMSDVAVMAGFLSGIIRHEHS